MDSMTPQQLDEWAAYDSIEPLQHTERVLACIAMMIHQFMGGEGDITEIVAPWTEEQRETVEQFKKRVKKDNYSN